MITIAIGSDHAGVAARKSIIAYLTAQGHTVIDVGYTGTESCDYPDIAAAVANAVTEKRAERGILICGTGIGMSIAANKFPGIRAAVCWNDEIAKLIAEHNAANILCLGARFASAEEMTRWTGIWLSTDPSREARHVKRLEKIAALERK